MSKDKPTASKSGPPPPPVMTILADHPILRIEDEGDNREPDRLQLYPKLGSVLDILRHRHTRPPMSIAIYGSWGTGKSSAMRWLADQLALWSSQPLAELKGHARVDTVWFDPWKYHSREDVWRGLIAEIILKCIDVANLDGQNVGNRLKQAAKQFGRFLGRSFLHVLANTEIGVKAGKGMEVEGKIKGEVFQDVFEEYNKTAHPEKAYLNEFESTLRQWVKDFYPQQAAEGESPRRLAVFIDDLDRCLPEVTLEVLEALKLYLNIPGLMFIVGLDREVVDAVISKHYIDHGLGDKKSGQYLDKMFQVEVDVPPTQARAKGFLAEQIKAIDDASDGYWSKMLYEAVNNTLQNKDWYKEVIESKIERIAEHNPREIKRLLNSTMLRAVAAATNKKLTGSEGLRFTQGAQVFLIHRVWKREFSAPAAMLLQEEVQKFLQRWSVFVRKYPEYRGEHYVHEIVGQRATSAEKTSKRHGIEELKASPPGEAEYAILASSQPSHYGETVELLRSSNLRDLLVIPYSLDVAREVAMDKQGIAKSTSAPVSSTDNQEGSQTQISFAIGSTPIPPFLMETVGRELNLPIAELTHEDLRRVVRLSLSGSSITSLSPLRHFSALQHLDLQYTDVTDLSPLQELQNLRAIHLTRTKVADLSPLSAIVSLETLSAARTPVTDLGPLRSLTKLRHLDLEGTEVRDIAILQYHNILESLNIANTRISSLAPLQFLRRLTEINASGSMITSLTPLTTLNDLTWLDISNTDVADLTPLKNSKQLKELYISKTRVRDLEAVASLTGLETLDITGKVFTDDQLRRLRKDMPQCNINGP